MHIHSKGLPIIGVTALILIVFLALIQWILPFGSITMKVIYAIAFVHMLWTISFFRVPHRKTTQHRDAVVASADGTVVAIEEVIENEYFKDKRIQVSVFMSPLNVHVNWFPMDGNVSYVKYHPGKFLIANHPKSSTENERNTIVVKAADGKEVMVRQIAGMLARRIVCFAKAGEKAKAGEEFGLIRFGSRIDYLLPANADVSVKIGDKVTGKRTIIAYLHK